MPPAASVSNDPGGAQPASPASGSSFPDLGPRGSRPRFDRRWLAFAIIMAVYLGFAASYARAIPPWQSPDEPAHFNYLAELGETGRLPVLKPGDYDGPYLETLKSRGFPPDLPVDRIRYEGHQPPLYYLAGAVVYDLAGPGPDRQKLGAVRGFSIGLGALALMVTFLIGRLVFPGWLALGPALFIAAVPQRIAITSSANNDVAAELMMALLIFGLLGVVLPAELSRLPGARAARWTGRPVPLGLLLGLLLLTKTTVYIGLLLVPVAYALAPRRVNGSRFRGWADRTALTWLVAALISGWWFLRNAFTYGATDPLAQARHDLVVAGQETTVLTPAALGSFGATMFRSFWGQFGWMGVPLDDRSYLLTAVLSIALAGGIVLWAWRVRRRGGRTAWERRWLPLLILTLMVLIAGVAGYNLKYNQPQGRYLFTALVPIGVLATLGVRGWTGDRWAPAGLLALYATLTWLDYWSLTHVIRGAFGWP